MMIRAFLVFLSALSLAPDALAGAVCPAGPDEKACLLQAMGEVVQTFPAEKRARLDPLYLNTVALSGDTALLAAWKDRMRGEAAPPPDYPDYASRQAEALLQETGWTGFLQQAQAGLPPFNTGRPELMAAGARLAPDAATRKRVVDAMFALAGPPGQARARNLPDSFEQGDFGHLLSELAMETCDPGTFDRAVALTLDPDSLRYAFWRARITGGAGTLVARIRAEGPGEDTRNIRAALDGYAAILQRGYCSG